MLRVASSLIFVRIHPCDIGLRLAAQRTASRVCVPGRSNFYAWFYRYSALGRRGGLHEDSFGKTSALLSASCHIPQTLSVLYVAAVCFEIYRTRVSYRPGHAQASPALRKSFVPSRRRNKPQSAPAGFPTRVTAGAPLITASRQMALRTTLARLAQPLRAQSAAFSAIPTPRPKYTERHDCLLYTSPSPRDQRGSRMPSSA